jgi:regulator of protease activity HflC (stomatin/prohibitin superfamily)
MPSVTGQSQAEKPVTGNRSQVVSEIGLLAMIVCLVIGVVGSAALKSPWPAFVLGLIGLLLLFSIKVARQWEKVAVLRLGQYQGLRGPGIFMILPIVDMLSDFIDQRIRVTDVKAESRALPMPYCSAPRQRYGNRSAVICSPRC